MRLTGGRATALVLALALVAGLAAGCRQTTTGTSLDESRSGGVTSGYAPATPVQGGSGEAAPSDTAASPPKSDVANVAEADRMIIRSKTLRLEVESTPDTVEKIRGLAKDHSGIITDLQVATDTEDWIYRYDESGYAAGDGAALRGWVTVRVPADSFEEFVDAASKLGTVKFQSEATEDVTQQHVDMAARLENLRAEEIRLREFFDAAKNVTEMLAIEAELARVRGEIESLDAQVKYLERQAAMATVTIELTENKPVVRPDGESWGFLEAITTGIRGAANVLTFGLSFIIATSPLWIVGLVIFFVARAAIRRRRAKRVATGVAPYAPQATGGFSVEPVSDKTDSPSEDPQA